MPKRKRREQQHLRQESSKRRSYQAGGAHDPRDVYKPGFPMNLLSNVKAFYVVGAGIAVIMVVTLVLVGGGGGSAVDADDVNVPTPSPTPTIDPSATPTATPTPDPKLFTAAEQVVDAENKDYRATIKTSMGDIQIDLKADVAPKTVNNFVFLAQKDFYDGVTFHRVLDGFVIQAGDPSGTGGSQYPGYVTQDEPNELRNAPYTISMAKQPGKSEFGSQFFINLGANTSLDYDNPSVNKYYPFAEVTDGMQVVDAIASVPVDAADKPIEPVTITDIVIEVSDK